MIFYTALFKSEIIKQIRDRRILLLIIVFITTCTASVFVASDVDEPASVPVGIVVPEYSIQGAELLTLLRSEDTLVEFILTDEDTLYQNVAAGNYECGYILQPDYDERIERGNYNDLYTLVRSESSALFGLVSESMSAATMQLVADDIARTYLNQQGLDAPVDGYILDEDERFSVVPIIGEDIATTVVAEAESSVFVGLLALTLCVFAISGGDTLAASRNSLYHKRLAALYGETPLLLIPIFVQSTFLFLITALSFLLLGVHNFLALFLFIICLATLSYLLAQFKDGFSAVLLPFFVPIALVLTPIFFDVRNIFPALRSLSALIPSTHFISYLQGDIYASLYLIALSVVYLLISIIVRKLPKKYS